MSLLVAPKPPILFAHTLPTSTAELDALLHTGVLDPHSHGQYLGMHDHFVEVVHRNSAGELIGLRCSGNFRTNLGGTALAQAIGGGNAVISATTPLGASGTASASSATTLTTGSTYTTNEWAGYIVACGPNASGAGSVVYGVVISNTNASNASVLTVDRWYNAATPGGAAGTTPDAACKFQILPGQAPAMFGALGTSGTINTTDTTLGSEYVISTYASGVSTARILGTWTETTTPSGSSSSTNQSCVYTWTSGTITFNQGTLANIANTQGFALCNSIVTAKGIPWMELTFTSVSPNSGDSLAITDTITLS